MKYTLRIGALFGIPVRVHATFPLILLLFAVEGWMHGGWSDAAWAVSLVLSVFVCVVLHEFGHSLQIRRYGIPVRDIVLLPIGGMARAERIPERPRHEVVVALSGPLVNFILAGLLLVVLWWRQDSGGLTEGDFVVNLLVINLFLGVFNLVPAFPMDGGRVLRGFLATRMSYVDATRYARNVGQMIAIVFVMLGFAVTKLVMLPVIALFIFVGGMAEERMVRARRVFGDASIGDFLESDVPLLSPDDTLESAIGRLPSVHPPVVPVTDQFGTLAGAIDIATLRHAVRWGPAGQTLASFVQTGFKIVPAAMPALSVYHMMRAERLAHVGVAQDRRFAGFVFLDDLERRLS